MKKLIVADDEAMVVRIMKLSLERAGYRVATARNGQEAFDLIESFQPDAIVSDIEMPVMTGQELAMKIRNECPEMGFPIFIVTSITAVEHRAWSSNLNNVFFLEKPVSMRSLLQQLEETLASNTGVVST